SCGVGRCVRRSIIPVIPDPGKGSSNTGQSPKRSALRCGVRVADDGEVGLPCEVIMRIFGTSFAVVALPIATLSTTCAVANAQQVVNSYAQLEAAVNAADDGSGDTTILIADGTYTVTSAFGLVLSRNGITVKSVSGNRNGVILQGDGMLGGTI